MPYQSDIFGNSILSMSAYADLYEAQTLMSSNFSALVFDGMGGAGMTEEQAIKFSDLFPEILAVKSGSGFSATVFQEAGADGPITVAIRGTSEALPDLVGADSELATCGAAYHQIVDMYNWWIKESSELNQSVNQYRIEQASSSSGPMPTGSVMELYREPGADGRATYLVLDQDAETGTGAGDRLQSPRGGSRGAASRRQSAFCHHSLRRFDSIQPARSVGACVRRRCGRPARWLDA